MPIRILPDEIASQIAAGEVVERPASVVKELLENSVDAEAKHISITVEGAGQRLIEVADDGLGISAEDLQLAITRHATSKLSSASDLLNIETLGFRGEALASIGSVSRLTITSRPNFADIGSRITVEGGHPGTSQKVGAATGTVVRVEDLFFNVPARKKFLRSDRTERHQIDALVTRYALAYPNIRFQLRQDTRQSLQTSGSGDRREIMAGIYGIDIAQKMVEVVFEEDQLIISGFISPSTLNRANRKEIVFYVNGRPIQDSALTTAVIQAYHTMLMVGRFPMAILFITLPARMVDVNVHPTKAEVRFRDRNLIFRSVGRSVRRALLAHTPVPTLSVFGQPVRWSPNWGRNLISGQQGLDPAWGMASEIQETESDVPENKTAQQNTLTEVKIPLLRLIGQVAATYLIAEGPDGLYLIDQHAAHERVLFERYMAIKTSAVPSQTLLEPVTVDMPPAASRLLEDQLQLLNSLGFKLDLFGVGTFIIRGLPAILSTMDPISAINVLVQDFEEDETPLGNEIEARLIARICKRAAVKAGQVLSQEEQYTLLRDLENCQAPRTCPHGRPTMIHLSVDLLERQFGRR